VKLPSWGLSWLRSWASSWGQAETPPTPAPVRRRAKRVRQGGSVMDVCLLAVGADLSGLSTPGPLLSRDNTPSGRA
jgi:hypothetical protein